MNLSQVMSELKKKGSAQTRKTLARHGAPETMFGVKVGDLKPIAKKIKGDQALALQLYDTGNSDAMYLAGLVVDPQSMKKTQLEKWLRQATWYMLSEYTVPAVTAESPYARALAQKWMKSKDEKTAAAGWVTYTNWISITEDDGLDLSEIKTMLKQVEQQIAVAPNRVRYAMNGFVIAVGGYVKKLLSQAQATAKKIGVVKVDMGDTNCKVPNATDYIEKIVKMNRVGKKRKSARC
jgi:3-methyladenine DNA glycosylase AlkD